MLKTKVIEKIRPSKKTIELFNSNQLNYTPVNGDIQVIERTNIKQVFPIVYYLDKFKGKYKKTTFIDFNL